MEPWVLLALIGLGTASALDGVSVGQVLLSRPLVSGTLAGILAGDPTTGLLVGGILEAVHLADFPVGAVRLPEPGPAAVPGVAAAWLLGGAGGLAVGVGLGVIVARLAGGSLVLLRRLNERILGDLLEGAAHPRRLARRHWLCIGADAARGAAVTAAGLLVAAGIPPGVAGWWGLSLEATVALLVVPAGLPLGALARRWARGRMGWMICAAGVLAGAVLGLLLGR